MPSRVDRRRRPARVVAGLAVVAAVGITDRSAGGAASDPAAGSHVANRVAVPGGPPRRAAPAAGRPASASAHPGAPSTSPQPNPTSASPGSPASAPASHWVRTLSEDDTGVELLLVSPEPETGPDGLRLPGFVVGGEPGDPEWFERTVTIAVPSPRGARLEMLSTVERDLGAVPRHTLPEPATQTERREAESAGQPSSEGYAVPARRLATPVPLRTVEADGVARLRGRDVVVLHYRPLQYRPDGGATFVQSARVRLRFVDRAHRTAPVTEPLHAALQNAASAAAWEVAPAPAAAPRGAAALPATRLRIRISARGIYELTYSDLVGAGVPSGIDPRTLRLFFDTWKPVPLYADSMPSSWQPSYEMQESAIWVDGEENSSFESGDRVVFYSLGPEGYVDLSGTSTDSLAYFRHPFDRDLYGWLVWDGDFGLRMPVVSAAAVALPETTRVVWHREHREEDLTYDAVDDLWYWEEIRATRPVRKIFNLDPGTPATGTLRLALGYPPGGGHHVIQVLVNNTLAGTADWLGSGTSRFAFAGVPLVAGPNTLDLRFGPGAATRGTDLLEFDVTYDGPLLASVGQTFAWSARPGAGALFELSGFGSQVPLVFDTTDPLRPVRLVGPTAAGSPTAPLWEVFHARPGVRAHYLAVHAPVDVPASRIQRRTVAPLRDRTTAPDMLIVTHESLLPAAQRLAAHRRAHFPGRANPDILVTTTNDIYENFSGGRMDPMAIRNYAKFLYGLDSPPRLGYLLLFGDGNHDMRQLLGASPPSFVPPLEPGYYDTRLAAYAVEDWFAEMETPRNTVPPYPVPDLGIGRLAARSLSEADRIVDKIVAYETTSGFGPWRARVLMTSDDECHPAPNPCTESFHVNNTEELVRQVPRDLDVVKFYLTEYPDQLGQKPQARSAFIRTWSDGCVLLNYQGHGAPRQLADEVLFLSTDIPSLTNGSRLPLFLPISCTVSEFDFPERQSMCEDLISSPGGGAIATIGATTPTYVGPNFAFNQELFTHLFADGATSHPPLGIVYQVSKLLGASGTFNETYLLLGDPALSLVLPHALVRFTSGTDTLLTGNRAHVEGEVISAADSTRIAGFAGQAEVEVRGTDDTSGYRRPPPDVFYLPYNLPGPPFYRGTVSVANGRFAFEFIVPVGARPGQLGRVSAYAASTALDARGEREDVVVRVAPPADSSLGAPRIALRFPNNRTRVKAGTPLTAEIHDENGINIQGTSLRSSIKVTFDRNDPLDVTAQFRYAAGSDSVGSLAVPLPGDLDPGPHVATVIASDNLQNTGTASLEFQVVASEAVQLVNVLAFPNPFRDWTRFFFEITDPAQVEVRVFTTSGREVWHHSEHFSTGTQQSIKWDGVDLEEDTVANGTYVYRVRAVPERAGSPPLESIGKVVVMR